MEETQALLEHIAMVLPADQGGEAGGDGLVHQQVMQADEQRPDDQGDHRHPDQGAAVLLEEHRAVGRAAGQVDDLADEVEQGDLDQGADQTDRQ
ncbi:hypothetical protein, partial [Nocardioides kribbensis]|uniref:hypothetical protein n=1 Tax=Nocardioides kribbensis TaxID=305517 RepID=UPI0032DBA1C3